MTLTPSQLLQAREWLADCQWADVEPEDFADIPDKQIERGIARHFDGGIAAFIATCN